MNTISRRGFLTVAIALPAAAIAACSLPAFAFAPLTQPTPQYPAMDLSHFDNPLPRSLHTPLMEHRERLTVQEVAA